MIEKKIDEMWAKTKEFIEKGTFEEHLAEQLEIFSTEILPPLSVRAFFKGVGKLDQEAADIVLKEVGKACGDFALGHMVKGGCVCPLVKALRIEPTRNHCLCTLNHLKHLYETGLGRPVEVELVETYLRGGNSCTIRMSW